MSAFSAAAQDEDGDIIKTLQARVADLEAQLYAVGAGGVGNMEQPQSVDWPEVDRLLKTVKYLIGIAERGAGRKMRNDETVEQFVLSYVRSLEQPQGEQEPVAWQSIEAMAVQRYKVVPAHDSMFYRHAVVAGDGTQQLYIGRETECENIARKFAGAFLDGAYVALLYTHPQNLRCKSTQARLATLWGYEKPRPTRQPLTDAQINDHRLALPYDGEDLPDPWDFKQGVKAAERAHGIVG